MCVGGGRGWLVGARGGKQGVSWCALGSTKFGRLLHVTSFLNGDGMALWPWPLHLCACVLLWDGTGKTGLAGLAKNDSGRGKTGNEGWRSVHARPAGPLWK